MDRPRKKISRLNSKLPLAVDKLAIFGCIRQILQGLRVEMDLAMSCKFDHVKLQNQSYQFDRS
ncbi:hypothetical protein MXB_4810 [Myxobolus squamalis]|nr:hypothetical protein MXB_4810 [Myxobolus squamalis]